MIKVAGRTYNLNYLRIIGKRAHYSTISDAVQYPMYQSGWNFKLKLISHIPKYLQNFSPNG